jgi:hypothetical protein
LSSKIKLLTSADSVLIDLKLNLRDYEHSADQTFDTVSAFMIRTVPKVLTLFVAAKVEYRVYYDLDSIEIVKTLDSTLNISWHRYRRKHIDPEPSVTIAGNGSIRVLSESVDHHLWSWKVIPIEPGSVVLGTTIRDVNALNSRLKWPGKSETVRFIVEDSFFRSLAGAIVYYSGQVWGRLSILLGAFALFLRVLSSVSSLLRKKKDNDAGSLSLPTS